MSFIFLIMGFFFLIKGADLFVEGASSIAGKFHVPSMIIGLTIVAMGTSAPEAAVSITSSLAGQNDMSVANVVGSNFFNILIVLGISSILAKLPVEKNTIKKDTPLLILACILLIIFSFDLNINMIEGLILLSFFIYFLSTTIKSSKKNNNDDELVNEAAATTAEMQIIQNISLFKTILFCLFGIVGIILGGDMVVDSATKIALTLGMSANLVGLTIVAVGTSLPEFVTSIIAVKKGETEIAIGNVIGSNIFNILLILGLAAIITPIKISFFAFIDVIFMTIITILLYLFIKKYNSLQKIEGYIFVVIYITYMIYTIIR